MFFNSISANLKDFSIRFWEFRHILLKLLLIFFIFYFYINCQQNVTFLEFVQDDSSQEQTPNDSVKNVLFSVGLGVLACVVLFFWEK